MLILPEHMTYAESLGPAMEITDQKKANEYFEALIQRDMKYFGLSREQATKNNKINLGYYAGYYNDDVRERVERLFNCSHPYFGKIAEVGAPTPDQALNAGIMMESISK